MSEFNPQLKNEREDLGKFAGWLEAMGAKLDASQTGGNLATEIIVADKERNGSWVFPLEGGIQVVDENDLKFMTQSSASVKIGKSDTDIESVEVSYLGTDDESRSARIDTTADPQFVPNR